MPLSGAQASCALGQDRAQYAGPSATRKPATYRAGRGAPRHLADSGRGAYGAADHGGGGEPLAAGAALGSAGARLSLSRVSEAARPSPQVPRGPRGPARGSPGLQRPRPRLAGAGPVDRLGRRAAADAPPPAGATPPR